MRAMNALPVDDDILDRIFHFLPDFRCLRACLLTSKAFYNVFQRHKTAILRSIAANIAGPALEDALVLARFHKEHPEPGNEVEYKSDSEEESDQEDNDSEGTPDLAVSASDKEDKDADGKDDDVGEEDEDGNGEDEELEEDGEEDEANEDGSDQNIDEDGDAEDASQDDETEEDEDRWPISYFLHLPDFNPHLDTPPTRKQARKLKHYAKLAHQLQDIFSARHKDRTSQTSVLTPTESLRFLRATYRIILFQHCFDFLDEVYDAEWHEGVTEKEVEATMKARREFLERYPTEELKEMLIIARFIAEPGNKYESDIGMEDYIGVIGLESAVTDLKGGRGLWVLSQFDANDYADLVDGYLERPMEAILQARSEHALPTDDSIWRLILDEVHGEQDACEHCGVTEGLKLWNESNWNYFQTFSSLVKETIPTYFPGKLAKHLTEGVEIKIHFDPDLAHAKFLKDIFALKSGDYSNWTEVQWTCESCLVKMIKDHIVEYWVKKRETDGRPLPKETCWYGWNCRTQTNKKSHAMKLNHFCKPTRGEGA